MNPHEPKLKELKETFTRRIREIEESPNPTVSRRNKLFYELEKERMEAQLDAQQRGRPSIVAPGLLSRFIRSMGFEAYNFAGTADAAAASYDNYKAIIDRLGFPEKCCERAIAGLAMCDVGDRSKPTVIFVDNHGCDQDRYTPRCLADWFNIPAFFVDVPLNEDEKPSLANLNYIASQLGEFIEWAEKKVPGVKYDKDRHIEMLEIYSIAGKLRREIYELLKHVPCPIAPQDALRKSIILFEHAKYPNMQKGNEYLRACRDELGERVASGKGPYPEERLRLLWAGQSPELEVLNPCNLLIERKVALPLVLHGSTPRYIGLRNTPIGEVSEYGVKLSPLQEEARAMETSYWGGPGKRWSNGTLEAASDIGAQGIIHFLLIGCTPMRGMGSVVSDRAEKELGIPVLNIEGRQMDRDYMNQERFEKILSYFIDKCFDWAAKRQQ